MTAISSPFTNNGWIAPRVLVLWDDSRKTAKIYDGFIDQLVGEPLAAKVVQRNEMAYDLSWRVNDIPVSNARTKVDGLYSAVFNMQQNTLSIRGVITGYANAAARTRQVQGQAGLGGAGPNRQAGKRLIEMPDGERLTGG